MNRTAAGVFDTCTAADKVVRELERLGISGEQVEVVNDALHDARGIGVVPQPNQSSEDYTVVIVRPSDDEAMEQTKHLMDRYGARLFRWQISDDGAPIMRGGVGKCAETSIGRPGATGDPTDLEGRGTRIRVRVSDTERTKPN
jgi:hypothetical protein